MLIAPTEPKQFLTLGDRSSVPEQYGADFLFLGNHGLVGIQRKEVRDFINSSRNGLMSKELAKMSALDHGVLLVEGRWMWASSGVSMLDPSITREYIRGVLWSVQGEGVWLAESDSIDDSVAVLSGLERWAGKQSHHYILRRNPGPKWAEGSRAFWIHFAQGIDGLGVERASRLVDHFQRLPLGWTVGEKELMEVAGIGKGLAKRMMEMFGVSRG